MKARKVYRLSLFILSFASIVNIVVAVRVMFALRNPVNYNFRIVEPPVFTNLTSSVAFPDRLPGTSSVYSLQHTDVLTNSAVSVASVGTNHIQVAIESYHYMRVGGSPRIRLNGFNYCVGDVTAYGVITAIYPERVYLESGYISNSRRVFDISPPVVFQPSLREPLNKEKISYDEHPDNS